MLRLKKVLFIERYSEQQWRNNEKSIYKKNVLL